MRRAFGHSQSRALSQPFCSEGWEMYKWGITFFCISSCVNCLWVCLFFPSPTLSSSSFHFFLLLVFLPLSHCSHVLWFSFILSVFCLPHFGIYWCWLFKMSNMTYRYHTQNRLSECKVTHVKHFSLHFFFLPHFPLIPTKIGRRSVLIWSAGKNNVKYKQ